MSQRNSEYARIDRDVYETPEWVTEALLPHFNDYQMIWEPACGSEKMADVLVREHGVFVSDISRGVDFLEAMPCEGIDAIVTNPPYSLAQKFIERSLHLMEPRKGFVAMLLRTDYDHAKGRRHLFADCPAFSKKLVLLKRIVWFERKGAAPSFNHAWYIWDWNHSGPPTIAYGPEAAE